MPVWIGNLIVLVASKVIIPIVEKALKPIRKRKNKIDDAAKEAKTTADQVSDDQKLQGK